MENIISLRYKQSKYNIILGNFFIKHHEHGSPKLRHIWVTEDLSSICWADPSEISTD